jgi:undecaprenyl-diphosphatase
MELSIYLKAIILGLVEGLTEFLPVSSTGHLILFGDLLKFHGSVASVFDIVIQMGAIAAVLIAYRERFVHVATSFVTDKGSQRFILLLLVAFLPAAVIGAIFHQAIKDYLFNTQVVAIALIVGGVIMLAVDRMKITTRVEEVDNMSLMDAFKIGIFQCFAMVPGISRSGATIIGGMVGGLTKKASAEFSFFLAVPTLTAAALYDLYKNWHSISPDDWGLIAAGFLSSLVFGYLVIIAFIRIVVKVGFTPFAIYRIVLGAALLAFL